VPSQGKSRLGVVVDDAELTETEARALWDKFSAHMEANKGDLGGFAKAHGFTSAHPTSQEGRAVLVLSHTKPQEAYGARAKTPPPPVSKKPHRSR
jgi:hypothetical protein